MIVVLIVMVVQFAQILLLTALSHALTQNVPHVMTSLKDLHAMTVQEMALPNF
jgi:hypothetical protein